MTLPRWKRIEDPKHSQHLELKVGPLALTVVGDPDDVGRHGGYYKWEIPALGLTGLSDKLGTAKLECLARAHGTLRRVMRRLETYGGNARQLLRWA